MVCVPCIVVPFLLWVFHKFIRPFVIKFWPWSKQEKIEDADGKNGTVTDANDEVNKKDIPHSNGAVSNGHAVTAGGGDKKTN